jgi:hypothetical protein
MLRTVRRTSSETQPFYAMLSRMQPQVLCDVHLVPMTQPVTLVGKNQPWSGGFGKCPKPNCPRLFNRDKGYAEIRQTLIVSSEQIPCRYHAEPKAIVAVGAGKPVWQCLHENCLCRETAHGDISVGQMVTIVLPKHGRFMVRSIGDDRFATIEMVGNRGEGDFSLDYWENVPIDDLIPLEVKAAS